MELVQYEIVLVNLDTTIGSEMKKIRPALIISPVVLNKYLNTVVIAPITNSSKEYPTRVAIKNIIIKGWILLDKIRTIDRQTILKKIEILHEKDIKMVKQILKETFVD